MFDPYDPAVQENPYPIYRQLRREAPVYWCERGFWVLSRYDDIYIGGSFNGWDPAGTLMTRPGPAVLSATVTLIFPEGDALEYKYTRGSWDHVEKGATCEEIDNRTVAVVYGTDGTMVLEDTVRNWRNTDPCGD